MIEKVWGYHVFFYEFCFDCNHVLCFVRWQCLQLLTLCPKPDTSIGFHIRKRRVPILRRLSPSAGHAPSGPAPGLRHRRGEVMAGGRVGGHCSKTKGKWADKAAT